MGIGSGIRTEVLPGNPQQALMESAYGRWWFGTNLTTQSGLVSRNGRLQPLGGSPGDVGSATYGWAGGVTTDNRPCLWNLKSGRQTILGASGIVRGVSDTLAAGQLNGLATVWSLPNLTSRNLQTPQAGESAVHCISGTQAAGAYRSGDYQALYWPTLDAAPTQLTPANFTASYAYGMDSTQQVGRAWVYSQGRPVNHPALWSGTAASFIDLLPSGFSAGLATKTLNGWQIGILTSPSGDIGVIWHGSAASVIDLKTLVPAGKPAAVGTPVALTMIDGHTVAYGYYYDLGLIVRWWLD